MPLNQQTLAGNEISPETAHDARNTDTNTTTDKPENEWELSYGESDQWEHFIPGTDQYLFVGTAGRHRDANWVAVPYFGELTCEHFESSDCREFESMTDVIDWADQYIATHPTGHDLNELHYGGEQ